MQKEEGKEEEEEEEEEEDRGTTRGGGEEDRGRGAEIPTRGYHAAQPVTNLPQGIRARPESDHLPRYLLSKHRRTPDRADEAAPPLRYIHPRNTKGTNTYQHLSVLGPHHQLLHNLRRIQAVSAG